MPQQGEIPNLHTATPGVWTEGGGGRAYISSVSALLCLVWVGVRLALLEYRQKRATLHGQAGQAALSIPKAGVCWCQAEAGSAKKASEGKRGQQVSLENESLLGCDSSQTGWQLVPRWCGEEAAAITVLHYYCRLKSSAQFPVWLVSWMANYCTI